MAIVSPYDQGRQDEFDRILRDEGVALRSHETVARVHPVLREMPIVRAVDINNEPVNLVSYINALR